MEERDASGDGGVTLRLTSSSTGESSIVREGQLVEIKYVGRFESSGAEFDRHPSFSFVVGRGEVIQGLDVGLTQLRVGDIAVVRIRHDYGYGENGLLGKIPGFATLVFELEVLSVACRSAETRAETLLLPPSEDAAVTMLTVGGAPVKLDGLGPIIINSDGSTSRIANWAEMTPEEQERTQRIIAKRNMQRIQRSNAGGLIENSTSPANE